MDTLLLDSDAVDRYARMNEVIGAIESAFVAHERETAQMPPKSYIDLPQYNGDFRSMPAYVETDDWDAAGIKWVNVHPDNPEKFDLPTVIGMVIYSDPETAAPLAIMDGTSLTMIRTGAAAAVATDHLADPDARSLGIVGAGVQAYSQLEAISRVRPIETVVISDIDDDRVSRFIETFEGEYDVTQGSIADAGGCDVLSTVTPVESPIVDRDDLGDRIHINAIGADAAGKQELSVDILTDATVVIDDYEQCVHSGEINVPWSQGLLDDDDIYAELGRVIDSDERLRERIDGITVFDSTGLAIQDIATAHVVYSNAPPEEVESFTFVDTP